jgi:hypothetical protein
LSSQGLLSGSRDRRDCRRYDGDDGDGPLPAREHDGVAEIGDRALDEPQTRVRADSDADD